MSHVHTRINQLARMLAVTLAAGLPTTAFAAPMQDAEQETPPATAPAKDLPEAKKVLQQAIDAMGGRKAFEAVESSHMKTTMSAMGMEMKAEMWSAKPDKLFVKQSMPMGEVSMGVNGKIAWGQAPPPQPVQLIEPDQLGDVSDQANMYAIIPMIEERYGTLETVDRVQFAEQECFKVRLADRKNPDPNRPESEEFAFFNVETALAAGMQQSMPGPTGAEMVVKFTYDEFKEFGDLKLFTRITIEQGGMQMAWTIDELTFNEVDMAVFAVPEDVQKLYDEKKQAEAEAAKAKEGEGDAEGGKEEEVGPATKPETVDDPELAQFPEEKRAQIKKQLDSFLKNEDPGYLNMVVGILEGQLGSVPEAERPQIEYIIKKVKERIAELEGGGGK